MFVLLSRVLLWLLLGTIIFSLFQRFYPSGTFVGRLILVIFLLIVLLSFVNPNEPAVASLWRVISFPLRPLGASILLMILGAQRIKGGGGMDAPGGYLIGWALTILLLASTPAVAYFLVRSPVAASLPTTGTLVAFNQDASMSLSDLVGDSIMPTKVAPYLLQTPGDITRRGLRLEDFVPNAQTLALTTAVWDSYLNQVYGFIRPR
ncbi:hypothetical protein [Iningainema tapete]|uniref:Uncharacterized protein n=1 Tax=Iningainema tapete BLCC-T55 TaxID=2748662 RepID=A0A8J7BZ71_9CYAN|nr:hypothetical protein [Iningainema tapete]MBD2776987.1 hypothetical protein [Iningainema tapete BLCC-T55]